MAWPGVLYYIESILLYCRIIIWHTNKYQVHFYISSMLSCHLMLTLCQTSNWLKAEWWIIINILATAAWKWKQIFFMHAPQSKFPKNSAFEKFLEVNVVQKHHSKTPKTLVNSKISVWIRWVRLTIWIGLRFKIFFLNKGSILFLSDSSIWIFHDLWFNSFFFYI